MRPFVFGLLLTLGVGDAAAGERAPAAVRWQQP